MGRVRRHENGTGAGCKGCRRKAKRKNSPRCTRMKSTATELENAWWNTQRHLFSLPKP